MMLHRKIYCAVRSKTPPSHAFPPSEKARRGCNPRLSADCPRHDGSIHERCDVYFPGLVRVREERGIGLEAGAIGMAGAAVLMLLDNVGKSAFFKLRHCPWAASHSLTWLDPTEAVSKTDVIKTPGELDST